MCFLLSEHFLELDSVLQVKSRELDTGALVALPTWGKREEGPEKHPGRTLWQGNDCAQRGWNEQDRLLQQGRGPGQGGI